MPELKSPINFADKSAAAPMVKWMARRLGWLGLLLSVLRGLLADAPGPD